MKGILGRKAGMTTVFSEDGKAIPVTVIEVKPNVVLQVKTKNKDGYAALQLGVFDKKDHLVKKAELGNAKKANTKVKKFIREIRDLKNKTVGDVLDISIFDVGEYVDVTGISKGKGFQGSIKRHGQSRGPMSHGSKSHRVTGSLGSITGTVKKTKKMPGHMGYEKTTMQNLEIVGLDHENEAILIKGSIPGPNKAFVIIKEAIKKPGTKVKNPIKLVNVKEAEIKNQLLEEAKHVGANITSKMSIAEMKTVINDARIKHETELKEFRELTEEAKMYKISNFNKMKLPELRAAVEKAKEIAKNRDGVKE